MVLHDDDWMCMFCSEHCESQQQYACHLSTIHNVYSGPHVLTAFTQRLQSTAPPTYYSNNNNNMNALSSPFVPTPRRPLIHAPQQQQQQPNAYAHYSHTPRQTPPAHLLTPPSSTGTASPLPPAQRSVQTPGQIYPSPHPAPQQVPSYSPSQQNGAHMVCGNMLSRRNMGYITPHQLPQQPLQRQSGPRKTHTPTSVPKRKSPTPATKAGKLPPELPPLPQAIYELGFTDADFDPNIHHDKFCIQSRYIDIPASIDIADAHMFNANPNTILGFGNLLRLAGRYADWEITEKINARRPKLFKNALIKKRLQAAVKWAAERPEWQGVGNTQTWLNERQRARHNEIANQRCKRGREDDRNDTIMIHPDEVHEYGPRSEHQHAQLATLPPAKRMRPAVTATPATSPACNVESSHAPEGVQSSQHAAGSKKSSFPTPTSSGTLAGQHNTTTLTNDLTLSTPESISSPAVANDGPVPTDASSTTTHDHSTTPAPEATSTTAQTTFTPSDLADLAEACGSDNAMALVNALGIGGAQGITTHEEVPAPVSDAVEPGEKYDDIFEEFLAHSENFMSPFELWMGEKWAEFVDVSTRRRGMTR